MSEPESTNEAQGVDPVARELLASRERLGISQREMADALEVHPSTLSRYESGKLKVPSEVVDRARALVQDAEASRRIAPAPPPSVEVPAAPAPAGAAIAPAPAVAPAAPVAHPTPAPAPPLVPAPAAALARAPDLRLLTRRLTVWGGLLAAGQLALMAGLVLTRCTGAPLWSWGGSAFTRGAGARTEANPGLDLPPCHRGETEIGGNCWALLEVHSPCPDYALEHDGKCYVPPPRDKRRSIAVP